MNLVLMNRMPSRDAWLIYEFLNARFEGGSGSIPSTSYDLLTTALNALRLVTERGAAFTAAVVKNRIAQLERVGAVVREKISGALFSLRFCPFAGTDSCDDETTSASVDHYGGRSLFDFVGDSVAASSDRVDVTDKTAKSSELPSAPVGDSVAVVCDRDDVAKKPSKKTALPARQSKMKTVFDLDSDSEKVENSAASPIVKNKLINKTSKKQEKSPKKPTLNDLVDRIDKTRPQIASLRSKIVARVWEPWIRSDLIDRLVAMVYYRWTSLSNVFAFCRHAVEQRDVYKASNGRRGASKIYETLTLDVKTVIEEQADVDWIATRPGLEKEPLKELPKPLASPIRRPKSDVETSDNPPRLDTPTPIDDYRASIERIRRQVCGRRVCV